MEKIFLVDDEKELVDPLSMLLRREFGDESLRSTSDPFEAKRWLETERPSVLLTDVRMSGFSGLDLLSIASSRWGSIPIILMTAYADEALDDLVRFGTFKYLPKPFQTKQLISMLRGILSAPKDSFGGNVVVSMLADVIQLHTLAWSTGALYIDSEEGGGSIWFSKGQIIHAATVGSRGEVAFYELIRRRGGAFSFVPDRTTAPTIQAKNSELLLEAYRRRDEAMRPPEEHGDEDFDIAFDLIDEPEGTEEINGNVQERLTLLEGVSGFIGGCLVDLESRTCLGSLGMESAQDTLASSLSRVLSAEKRARERLGTSAPEEILSCLSTQYHLLRPIKSREGHLLYAIFDRAKTNLAFARLSLQEAEKDLVL